MADANALYRRDFVAWSKEQAEALRSAAQDTTNQPIDWENVAEEIESLGISQRSELKSQIRGVIEHLLKPEYLELSILAPVGSNRLPMRETS